MAVLGLYEDPAENLKQCIAFLNQKITNASCGIPHKTWMALNQKSLMSLTSTMNYSPFERKTILDNKDLQRRVSSEKKLPQQTVAIPWVLISGPEIPTCRAFT
ncbi:hypothetical protein JTE90_029061 [Oedothorax gibbosus]|uniref:Uncharacterized protein n=1 Tax=Oedothorax gibbosus TaxID=931172 RepID=A0AAV6UWG6_9ARAC|nr:hypothetical protein JTE90_029061 [Oedothorax gibbosus]